MQESIVFRVERGAQQPLLQQVGSPVTLYHRISEAAFHPCLPHLRFSFIGRSIQLSILGWMPTSWLNRYQQWIRPFGFPNRGWHQGFLLCDRGCYYFSTIGYSSSLLTEVFFFGGGLLYFFCFSYPKARTLILDNGILNSNIVYVIFEL